jgi:hypothetical protein
MAWDWSAYPVGTRVRCADPDGFLASVRNKLRDREGVVERHQMFSGAPIVKFPAAGRRREFKWVPPRPSDLEIVP